MLYKIAPWAHQLKDIQRTAEECHLPGYALFHEMGTGKTSTAINILRTRWQRLQKIESTIIFCPPLVIPNWEAEWHMHATIAKEKVIQLYGSGVKRLKTFMEATRNPQEGKIFITNYESMSMDDLFEAFRAWRPEVLVFDESHKLKAHNTNRSKKADTLANPVRGIKPYTLLLSGSPILNSPMDIFQQYRVLDGGQRFGANFFAFRAKYFRDRNSGIPKDRYFPKWELMTKEKDGVDAMGEITQKIFSIASRVEKSQCFDLPELNIPVKVGMSPTQARLYKEMKNDLITFLDSKACVATLAITKALRLMQITSGFLAVEQSHEESLADPEGIGQTQTRTLEATPKIQALKELLDELCVEQGRAVLIWATWRHNYEQIREVCKSLGLKHVEVHGGISDAKKREAVAAFQTDSSVKVFLGHPGSGGIGINLVRASHSIFYSRTFSLEHYLQARSRNHRAGAIGEGHKAITHYHLVCEGTIDELVVEKLAGKIEISDKMLTEMLSRD
jgi:SNF2 family DNA or RNA helicase